MKKNNKKMHFLRCEANWPVQLGSLLKHFTNVGFLPLISDFSTCFKMLSLKMGVVFEQEAARFEDHIMHLK